MDNESRISQVLQRNDKRIKIRSIAIFVIGITTGVIGMLMNQVVTENHQLKAELQKVKQDIYPANADSDGRITVLRPPRSF